MGTKNNPGKFDCYSRAEPDEPVFVLLGRDPVAWLLVKQWVLLRARLRMTEKEVLEEADACAESMLVYAVQRGKADQAEAAKNAWLRNGLLERVRELEALCKRAADALSGLADAVGVGDVDDLVRELRGA